MSPEQIATAALSFFMLSGCTGTGMVVLRPDRSPGPEPCPKKALETMANLRLHVGSSAWIDLDLNKKGQDNITVNDGPIESALQEALVPPLYFGTRLYGRVWTGGPDVVIRYYQAQPLDSGPPIDICAVARLSDGQLRKKPGPAPGSAVLEFSIARLVVVDSFR